MSQCYTVLGNVLVHHDLPVIVDLCSAGCTQLVVLVEHTKLESSYLLCFCYLFE